MERSLVTALGVDKQLNSYDKESKTVGKGCCKPCPSGINSWDDNPGRYQVSAVAGWVAAHDRCGYAFTDVGTIGGKVILSSCPMGTKAFESKAWKLQ